MANEIGTIGSMVWRDAADPRKECCQFDHNGRRYLKPKSGAYARRMRELCALVRAARRNGLTSYAHMYLGELRWRFAERRLPRHMYLSKEQSK